ncbi:unnamed protein product, partial [Timema podura]|nr:unnamed protein product [Timema podura]
METGGETALRGTGGDSGNSWSLLEFSRSSILHGPSSYSNSLVGGASFTLGQSARTSIQSMARSVAVWTLRRVGFRVYIWRGRGLYPHLGQCVLILSTIASWAPEQAGPSGSCGTPGKKTIKMVVNEVKIPPQAPPISVPSQTRGGLRVYKIVVLGDGGVALTLQFVKHRFLDYHDPTI